MNQGEKFKEKRLATGLNQSDFAEKVGLVKNTISNYETSKVIPKIKLERICKIMNWDIEYFLIEDKTATTLETRIELLERKVQEQDKKIETLENKIAYNQDNEPLKAAEPAAKYKK